MKRIYSLLFCAAALLGFVACDNTDNNGGDGPGVSNLYVLNGGSYGSNNASLASYDIDDATITDDLFVLQNGQGLGDTAQDMIVFEDKIFITVYGSGIIFVTDMEGTIIKEIQDDTYYSPRCLATDGESVYVSYYDGGVAKINPDTYAVTKSSANINPEQIAVANGNLYVTISQGYGNYNACNTIDVYDTSSMTYSKSIEVILNPTQIAADSKGNLYVISMGNYGYGNPAIYATLQKVDGTTGVMSVVDITDIEDATPTIMAMGKDDVLYVVEGVSNASTDWKMVGNVYAYDTTTGNVSTLITDGTTISNMYSLSAGTNTGEVYVGTSDYTNTGDIYVINADGTLQTTFGVGLNPMKVIPVALEE